MNTFRQLRDRLRDPGPCKPGRDPADHDADNLVRVLDDLLTALAQQDPAAEFQASLDKALADKVFAPIVDAQASRVCRPEPCDAQPERLPNVEQRPSVSRESAASLLTTAEPVLPPGCRLEHNVAGCGWLVMDTRSRVVSDAPTPERAATDAWWHFGAFMSREDYETLIRRASYNEAERLEAENKRLSGIVTAASDALTEVGETGPRIADGIRALARRIGDVQAGEGFAREVAEQEVGRLQEVIAGLETERDGLKRHADIAERRTEAHRAEISRLTDTIQRLRAEVAEAKSWDARRVNPPILDRSARGLAPDQQDRAAAGLRQADEILAAARKDGDSDA